VARLVICAVIGPVISTAAVADDIQRAFERAYFLQTHQRDPAAAAAAFEKVVAAEECPAPIKAEAERRLAHCREDVAAADLARLMPPAALVYAELTDPGEHARRLLKMLGFLEDPDAADKTPADPADDEDWHLLDFLPDNFSVSPALLEETEKFRGVAVAITKIDPGMRYPPEGVILLHPGDSNFLRGRLETTVQFLHPAEPIEGFKTYVISRQLWVTVTGRLTIVASSRQQIVEVATRLRNPALGGLAAEAGFRASAEDRKRAMLFAYARGPALLRAFGPLLNSPEAAVIRAGLDLDRVESVTARLNTTDDSVVLTAHLSMAPGHRSPLFGAIPAAPVSGCSLKYVPAETTAVALIGLGAAEEACGPETTGDSWLDTAMRFGRGLFCNVEEVAGFALSPPKYCAREAFVPECGIVFSSPDRERADALWKQMQAIAVALRLPGTSASRDVRGAGRGARAYTCPSGLQFVVVRADERTLIVGTPAAARAAIEAGAQGNGLQGAAFQPLLARLGPNAGKALLFDVGHVTQMLGMPTPWLHGVKVTAICEEGPAAITVRAEAAGWPKLRKALQFQMLWMAQFVDMLYGHSTHSDIPPVIRFTGPQIVKDLLHAYLSSTKKGGEFLDLIAFHLRTMEAQLQLYKQRHDEKYPAAGKVAEQLTTATNVDGSTTGETPLGPYMLEIPANPYNDSSQIVPVFEEGIEPKIAVPGGAGWQYDQSSGRVYPNHAEFFERKAATPAPPEPEVSWEERRRPLTPSTRRTLDHSVDFNTRTMMAQIELYRAHHGSYPDAAKVATQLTTATNANGDTTAKRRSARTSRTSQPTHTTTAAASSPLPGRASDPRPSYPAVPDGSTTSPPGRYIRITRSTSAKHHRPCALPPEC